eukprot:TRINITY_DN1544_c0_g2_i1.p1 TRINITY_DN1544_c0_g2~~TRINITY_DN1544_c0_g2_i1.p1  ORF type:complete len:125 (-),score=21.51 TRINITY_DN1544_c0_g2_i1:607-981(-)
MGDVRMGFAEDKNKVRNIVRGSAQSLHDLYKNVMCSTAALGILSSPASDSMDLQCQLYQDVDKGSRCLLLSSLPSGLLGKLGCGVGLKVDRQQSCEILAKPARVHVSKFKFLAFDGCESFVLQH